MPVIITPRRLQQRAELYHQLGQLMAAGGGLLAALELLKRNPPSGLARKPLGRILKSLGEGSTFSDALLGVGAWLPAFDIALLQAGEQSGRLPQCFGLLASHYTDRARLARQVIGDLLYPLLLLHLAVFLFPFPQLFLTGKVAAYAGQTLGLLAPLYLAVGLIAYALQGRHGEAWRGTLEKMLHPIPVLGAARRALALSRLAAALEALISAGITILEAWRIAALACGSPALRRAVTAWRPALQAGQTPADLLGQGSVFPDVFTNLYRSGEISGKLDESLRSLHQYYQEEGTRKLHLFAQWAPRLFYLLIVLLVAAKIVSFWLGYFQQIDKVINGGL
jgi:type II secretory pathway component PulF